MLALQTLTGVVNASQLEAWRALAAKINPSVSYLPCVDFQY